MSLGDLDNSLDTIEEVMIDKVFTNCDDDCSGKVSINKLLMYLRELAFNTPDRFDELDNLSSLFNSLADHNNIDIQSFRQAMANWIGNINQPSKKDSEIEVQLESLRHQNAILNEKLLEAAEVAEDSSKRENVKLAEIIKKLQNTIKQKNHLQQENEDLKSKIDYLKETFEKEEKSKKNQLDNILLKNLELEKNLERSAVDYQNSLDQIKELKLQNSKILMENKINENLSNNFEMEVIKLKTELNKALKNVAVLNETNKELKTNNFDLSQIIQLKEDQSKHSEDVSCPLLPVVIEEDSAPYEPRDTAGNKLSEVVAFPQNNKTLCNELKGIVGISSQSPICEKEFLSDFPENNSAESRDIVLYNLKNVMDVLQSTTETVFEIQHQLVKFADKMESKDNKDKNCFDNSEFRHNLMDTLSQYREWLDLLVCKKENLIRCASEMIKAFTGSTVPSLEDSNDKCVKSSEHDVELAKLNVIFKTVAEQLQTLSKPTVETDKDVEKKIWLLIMQHFLTEENYHGYLIQWANLKVTEKYDRTELRNYNYHHRTSKALPEYSSGGKYSPSDLEAYGTPLKLGRILNVKEIWHLVQDEVEKKYLGDNNSDEIVNSWPYDQGPYFCETKPPSPTPLVDGLTIECIDKASLFERNNNAEDFGDFDIHESYNEDHAASCPTLDEKCNFVTPENEDLAFHLLYSHLNSSNSSSTSGVIDVDFSSSSSRSQDGQKKRRDFIRSSHRMESGSQTSHSMESNTEIGASLPRHRSPSFRAAIESHSNINLLSATNSNNYLTPTSYQSNNQSEFLQCSRNRSLSFQAAIEDGQHSPTDTNDTDVIPASADTTPDNPNIAEGLALDTYGKTLSSGRTDSRSVNFQLNTTETDIRTEPLSSGNSSQYLKSIDDPYHGSLLKSDEYKKSFRAGMNQEVEVSVTYASPSTSLDSSTSDVPKKSCIRDSSLQKSTSNAEEASFVNSGETSLKTTRAPESELEMSPKKQLQSRNIRKLGVHSMDLPKKSIFQDEMVNSESLKNSNSCSQKPQEISSISKPAEETTVKKTDSETEEVTEDSKPDDSSGISENTTQLSKLREPSCLTSNESNSTLNLKVLRKKDNNLARKREQMKHMKMPELTELVENTSECNDSSKAFSTANTLLQPPASSDNMVLPSISDAFLMEFRVFVDQYANFSAEDLTEQEIENKFRDLSLAFKTDKQTLHQRLQIHKNSRDLAEENVGKELQSLRGASKALLQLSDSQTIDSQIQDAAKNIQNYVDVLEQAIGRISGRAEVFGAVKQEERMSCAMEIMMSYVESLKRIQEKELEEAKTLLDNKILNSEAGGDSSSLSRRAASLSNAPKNTHRLKALTATSIAMASAAKMMETTKRRASMAALSKNPSQIGPNSQTPMQIGIKEECTEHRENEGIMNKQEVYHRRSTLPAGKLLRHVSSFEKDQDSSEDLIDNIPIIDPTLLGTKEEQEKNEFRVGYRNGVGMKMDTMFEGLIQQQPNLVHVQNLMAETDLDNTSNKKLTLFVEVFREFQSDIASIWKGLNPFTQYTSIFIFATLTLVAILLPMFRRLNIAVDEKYYDMPPF